MMTANIIIYLDLEISKFVLLNSIFAFLLIQDGKRKGMEGKRKDG